MGPGERTADEQLAIGGGKIGEPLLDVGSRNKASPTCPAGRGIVENVEDRETRAVEIRKLFEVVLEENVLFVNVGVNESNLGVVEGVFENRPNDLHHRGDTGATSNHSKVVDHVGCILEGALGPLYTQLVADLKVGNVTRDVTLLISLRECQTCLGKRTRCIP